MKRGPLGALAAICTLAAVFAPATASVQDDVTEITISALHKTQGMPRSVVHVYYAAVVGRWGFTSFTAGEGGGDTIVHRVNGAWKVLGQGHGQMDHVILVAFGVPPEIADALLQGACPKSRRVALRSGVQYTSLAVRRTDLRRRSGDTTIPFPAFVTADASIVGGAPFVVPSTSSGTTSARRGHRSTSSR
jgi:hypothetical protein